MLPRYAGNLDETFFGQISGHVVPGSMFMIIGIWWLYNVVRQHVCNVVGEINGTGNSKTYRTRVWYEFTGISSCHKANFCKVPFEPTLKILFGLVGCFVELSGAHWVLFDRQKGDFELESINNFSHSTMYAFFALSGVIDILLHNGTFKGEKLQKMGHVTLGLAFFIEGFLFYFHLSGHSALDTHAHSLLYGLCFLISIILLIEAFITSPLLGLARCCCTILQGTWFYQVAFMLHGPQKWSQTSKAAAMFVPIAFAWHCFGVFLFLIFVLIFGQKVALSRCSRSNMDLSMQCLLAEDDILNDPENNHEQHGHP